MSEENTGVPSTENQDVETSVNDANQDTLNEANASESSDGSEVSRELYENQKVRAEKAEAELKKLKSTQKGTDTATADTNPSPAPAGLTREEAILFARGLSEEEVNKVSKIAQMEGVSLTDAASSEMFNLWKSAEDKKRKSQDASMAASKGAPQAPKEKTFDSKDLSPDEHKELWKKKMGLK